MFVSTYMITFSFKKEKGREYFSVKFPFYLKGEIQLIGFWGFFALCTWGGQEHSSFELVTRVPHARQ